MFPSDFFIKYRIRKTYPYAATEFSSSKQNLQISEKCILIVIRLP